MQIKYPLLQKLQKLQNFTYGGSAEKTSLHYNLAPSFMGDFVVFSAFSL